MNVKCPVCQTEYDLEPGKYKCECGATFLVEVPDEAAEAFAPSDEDPNKTIAPRHHADFDPAGDQTMPGKRDRKPDGYFEPGEMILNRYKVLGSLGRGGMGVVYKCFDEVGGIEIALKALPPELSHDEEEMEDIKANFQIVSKLVHQNICISKNLEKDSSNGNYYLIMECVDGEDLRRWIRRKRNEGPLTLDNVLPVVRQIAEALDYAHGEGIIHRDIKPGNVMIDQHGRIKILDFGLAAQIHSSMSRVSMAYHGTSGTATYMAPEQWRGQAQRAAADQYALAAMTYEMLAGRLPFEVSDTTLLREAVLNEQPQPIENLPKHVQHALLKALSKKPEERFASCVEFIDALSASKKGKKSISQKTLILILSCILIPVCLGGVGYLGYLGYREIKIAWEKRIAEKKKAAEEARLAAEKRRVDAERAERERRERIAEQERMAKEKQRLEEEARLLAARRAKEKAEAELKKQEQDRILAEKKRQDEIKEAERKAKIDQIYEGMEREIIDAFDKAKITAQAHCQKLLDARSSEIESLEKDKNAKVAKFEKKISNLNSQKQEEISIKQLDKLFPLYKPGDYVTVHSRRQGTISGTLYSVKGRSIVVNGREIDMDGIQQEYFFSNINISKRNQYISKTTAKYQWQIRLQENGIQKIQQKYQSDMVNIERKIEKAKNAVSLLEKRKYESLNLLKSNRDYANNTRQWHIKPIDYKRIIREILSGGGVQVEDNGENDGDTSSNSNGQESHKPSNNMPDDTGNNSVAQSVADDPYHFKSLVFYAPLENEETQLPTGQEIKVHGNVLYTKVNGIKCAYFDGKSYLTFPTDTIPRNDCSISLWVKCTQLSRYETNIFSSGKDIYLQRFSGGLVVRSNAEKPDDEKKCRNSFNYQAWNHIVYTFSTEYSADSPNRIEVFVNGKKYASFAHVKNGPIYPIGYIGTCRFYPQNNILHGYMSAIRVYNRVLQKSEITTLFHEFYRRSTSITRSQSTNFPKTIQLPNGTEIEMVKIKAGTFMMGSPENELGRHSDERLHRVTFTRDFWMGRYEITQRQWKAVMGNNPSHFRRGDSFPVEQVTWYDAKRFCDKLNRLYMGKLPAGYRFDLPTEEQWEYTCRAGTTTALNNGKNLTDKDYNCRNTDEVAWYNYKQRETSTHEVGRKTPNNWGLYDMHGNVWEWCRDWYDSPVNGTTGHVIRGGTWCGNADSCRSAHRFAFGSRNSTVGFRLALVPIQSNSSFHENSEMSTNESSSFPATLNMAKGITVQGDNETVWFPGKLFKPPYTIRAKCKTNKYNIRVLFLHGEIIFNWELDPYDLRLDIPGISSPRNSRGNGFVGINTLANIEVKVFPTSFFVYVNGKLRYSGTGNWQNVESQVGIKTALGHPRRRYNNIVTIKEFSVEPGG